MTETRATTPAFPPGRYGRRRDGRRRIFWPTLFGVAILAGSLLLAVRLYNQYGDPTYDAQVIRYTAATDREMLIDFTVRVPVGGAAVCALRARAYDGAEVGRREVTVAGATEGNNQQVTATEPIPTTARAFIGEVVRCRAKIN